MKATEIKQKNIDDFENKLVLNTCLIISIGAFVFSILSIIIGFEPNMTYITISAVVVYSFLFVFGHFYKKVHIVRWFIPIVSSIFINLVWLLNNVSNGPALTIFVLYYCFLILIGNKRQIAIFSVVIILNLIVLFVVEYTFFDSFPGYKSAQERILEIYIIAFISIIIAFSFIYYAKTNYIKQYQLARKADELKSAFLANMSHEIRTPLNAIVGFSSLLANRDYDHEKKEKYRRYITSNSDYLLHLVNDILDISKIESNQMDLVVEEFYVNTLFEQLKEEYSRMLINRGKEELVKVMYVAGKEKLLIKTDKFRFEQIIRNFLSNAIKFTDKGHVKFGAYQGNGKYVFYVEDTGSGMSQDDINKIFARFTKLNKNEDILHRGVGLGLFLSKQLANLMGGEIWVESEPDKGSTFYLSLPEQIVIT